jgi:hypothetical protein
MPNLRDFERRLGGLVEGLFSKTFRSGLQPVEIAKRLVREMEDGRQVGVNEVWAPNRFEISLSADDAPRFRQMESALVGELRQVVLETAAERDWGLVGPPEVEFFVDDTLRKGDLSCDSSMVEGEGAPEPAGAATPRAAKLVIHEEGNAREVPVDKGVVTIGRMADCDIVLKDKGASRRHAQLRVDDDVVTLTDLGSTNGTRLNGQHVQTRVLENGDKITVGTTVLEFRRE